MKEYICFVPVDKSEDETMALSYLFAANGLTINSLDEDDISAGFIGYTNELFLPPEILHLTQQKLQAVLMDEARTVFVIASLDEEKFYIAYIDKDSPNGYACEVTEADDFIQYFNECMRICKERKCLQKESASKDLEILERIWKNTVN
jgi:hypothetical protein